MAFFNSIRIAQDGRAHDVGFQVQGQAEYVIPEVQQFVGTDALQPLDGGNTVAHLDDRANIDQCQISAKFFDLTLDQ